MVLGSVRDCELWWRLSPDAFMHALIVHEGIIISISMGLIHTQKFSIARGPNHTRSVAAKFEVTAYSKLAPRKISNLCIRIYICIFEYKWSFCGWLSNMDPFWQPPHKFILGLCQPVTSNMLPSIRNYGLCHSFYIEYSDNFAIYRW